MRDRLNEDDAIDDALLDEYDKDLKYGIYDQDAIEDWDEGINWDTVDHFFAMAEDIEYSLEQEAISDLILTIKEQD